MFKILSQWYDRYFSSEEVVVLSIILLVSFTLIITMSQALAPVITALVLAFLMQGMVNSLMRRNVPELAAVIIVYAVFMGLLIATLFVLLPIAWGQLVKLLDEQLPQALAEGQILMEKLPERYPDLISAGQIESWIQRAKESMTGFGEQVLSFSFSKLPNVMGLLIFLVLVPVLVFFFLKDKRFLLEQLCTFLPKERRMLSRVWEEMNDQIANYVRGKVTEILIVGSVTYLSFVILGVKYAALLGVLVGLSVVVPYIGAAVVTIPVCMVGYFQFGLGSDFITLIVVYAIIQALDGNILVPLLFSEAVNLHPVAIIIAVLLFGGIWGLWGVFFAIPLATLIKAVLNAWPRSTHQAEATSVAN